MALNAPVLVLSKRLDLSFVYDFVFLVRAECVDPALEVDFCNLRMMLRSRLLPLEIFFLFAFLFSFSAIVQWNKHCDRTNIPL
jgi:hypothetical protein